MKTDIYNEMLSEYDLTTEQNRHQAQLEVNQRLILAGLYTGGFFEKAAFYGGTCLRIFHGLPRFSEDMDFSLLTVEHTFNFEAFFPPIAELFALVGRKVEIRKKDKRTFGRMESAFLKDNTEVYDLTFSSMKTVKIKIEVDTQPPLLFSTEQKLQLLPFSFMTRCFVPSDLFAGKMHAIVFRKWKNRIKGRDWFDFEWYVRHGIEINFKHLQERIRQFNGFEISKDNFIALLKERLSTVDINRVKDDVIPFVHDTKPLDIWSNDYFLQLTDMIRWSNVESV